MSIANASPLPTFALRGMRICWPRSSSRAGEGALTQIRRPALDAGLGCPVVVGVAEQGSQAPCQARGDGWVRAGMGRVDKKPNPASVIGNGLG